MGSVYRTAEGNLVLYSQEERVYLRTLIKEGMGRAVVLATDYASDLTDVLYRGTVYYAYKNIQGEILVRNISDHGVWLRLGEEGSLEGHCPHICTVGEQLILFYAVKNPLDGQYGLRCRVPETVEWEKQWRSLFEPMGSLGTEPPMIQTLPCAGGTLLVADPEHMIWWDEHGNGMRISKSNSEAGEQAEELRRKTGEMLEARVRQARSQWEREAAQMQEKLKGSYQVKLDQKDQLIESIKKQYEELMQVAESYRQEAIKWCGKFLS